ncbi:EpsG family protein [Flavobacterium amniphilum]|uniref:EpsG family protein n=1 Tax=Flavobacterium amniphilum TaxID=1834035 RepID=UPI00202A6FED|nr:EpsG family protein [Flavobacterium amniphilum]MCL9805132.1 EpsG family protein [Flavobacterium amniphilum]
MYYQDSYLFVYILSAIFAVFFSIEYDIKKERSAGFNLVFGIIIALCYSFVFGFRDYSIGSDTKMYVEQFRYNTLRDAKDFGFSILLEILRFFTNERGFFFGVSLLYNLAIILLFYVWDKSKSYLMYFTFTSFFFFETFGVNVIRSGLAIAFLLFAIILIIRNKRIKAYLTTAMGVSFHGTVLIPFLFFLIAKRNISYKLLYGIFFFTIALAYLDIGINSLLDFLPYVNVLFKNRFDSYINKEDWVEYELGFKASFVLFNTLFAVLGYFFYKKFTNTEDQNKYGYFLKVFLISSSFFFLSFNVAFSDRIGALSWIFLPFVLEPLLNNNKYRFGAISLVFLNVLMFTLFYNTIR